jgi:Ca2+/Na+ antiporter
MPPASLEPSARLGLVMLFAGLAALFICTRILARILPRHPSWIGARAVAYFLPIAAVVLVATFLGRTEIALGVLFGTSVGAMTVVIGYIALGSPVENAPQRWRRIWPFQLAAALIAFVSGFKGTLSWREAIALAIEGTLILGLWREQTTTATDNPTASTAGPFASGPAAANFTTVLNYASPPANLASRRLTIRQAAILTLQLILTGLVLGLAAWAVTRGTLRTSSMLRFVSTSSLAATAVSMAMVMPMMVGSWRLAHDGHAWSPITTQIGVVLLNLCLLLPILIVIPYAAAKIPALNHWAGDALAIGENLPRPLIFPAPMWRVDNIVLIVVGVLLLPVSFGKWSLGREEAVGLLAGYFFYLTAALASG